MPSEARGGRRSSAGGGISTPTPRAGDRVRPRERRGRPVPGGEPILLLGDGLARWPEVILRAVPGGRPAPPALWTPRAALVAALGRERLLAGQRDGPHRLVPGHGRRPAVA